MTVLGHWLILLAVASSVASAVFYFRAATSSARSTRLPRLLLVGSAGAVVLASAVLLTLILQHDFSNGYVYSYSDRSLPLHYLLSTFYAGQEGSFLFWALCAMVIGLFLARSTAKGKIEPYVMTVYMAVASGLLLLAMAKSPFRMLWEMIPGAPAGFVPEDGRGLNPLLQNFWMVIHPPVLFIGFAGMAVPYSFAIAGLWTRTQDLLVTRALAWILAAAAILGLGIILGAYWAYGVLGWGGYWGWDPVENSSLIPWIVAIALVHTSIAQRRTGKYVRTNILLGVAAYVFVVYSTFLTRSGILGDASVHSFTDPGSTVYAMLLGYLCLLGLAAGVLMAIRWKGFAAPEAGAGFLTRETALGIGALVLMISAVIILFGTSLPIFSTTRVEPSFYDATNLPVGILMGLLIALSLYLQWESQDGLGFLRGAWKAAAAALAATLVAAIAGVRDATMVLFAWSAFFAIAANLEVAVRTWGGNWRALGGKLAHIGTAVFFLGVIGTGKYADSRQLVLPKATAVEALGYSFTYTGSAQRPDGKYAFRVRADRGGRSIELQPVMFQAGEQGVMRNPDIANFLTNDLYVSPVSLQEAGGGHSHGTEVALPKGRPVKVGDATLTFVKFEMSAHGTEGMGASGMKVGSEIQIARGPEKETIVPVMVYVPNAAPELEPARSSILGAEVRLTAMNAGGMEAGESAVTVEVGSGQHGGGAEEALIVDASVKPFVGLLWLGFFVMMVGFGVSIAKRSREA
jgi:cytochrome c-type biogenesis protein CcmF